MRKLRWSAALMAAAAGSALAAAGWQGVLSYPGGGYWRCRVPVVVHNATGSHAMGRAVGVRVGTQPGQLALAGHAVAGLRVCLADGSELLYDVAGADGSPRRDGLLAEGDRLVFGAECRNGGSQTVYVYSDNPSAWPVPDPLGSAAPFANGGFEEGNDAPRRWRKVDTTPAHRVAWVAEAPHGGKRCTRCDVNPGAEPRWVKWVQDDIGVAPDSDYRIEAWVKAKDVKGRVGWYVHVHGDKPMAINQVAHAGDGTYDWKQVTIAFHTPPDAVRASIGTVLHGTGTAWFDDARLVLLTKKAPLRAQAGAVERRSLAVVPVRGSWSVGGASHRVELKVRNWADAAIRPLVAADFASLVRRIPRAEREARIRVVDPASGAVVPSLKMGDQVVFAAAVPPRSEASFHAYFSRPSPLRLLPERKAMGYADLVKSPANLVANPSFEKGQPLPSGWILSAESDQAAGKLYRAATDGDPHSGTRCARLDIPADAPLRWSGWHTAELPVKPLATYLYAAALRCKDVDGSVQLHGHFHDAEGKLCERVKHFGIGPALSGDQGWTLLRGLIQTPADCATVSLHLTMNAHGTVWHDDVFFGEAVEALVGTTQPHRDLADRDSERRGYTAWLVNPIVKVFREDLPAPPPKAIAVSAARNEREPFQLALRATRDLADVAVAVDPPRNKAGKALPDLAISLVGYVPIDHPSSYYRVDVPAWHRKLPPRGRTGCDGWAGLWPDPLPPCTPFALPAYTTQPIWATVHVPPDATPGTYRGTLTVRPANAPALAIPLEVTVRSFTLPTRSHVKVIYDFREPFTRMFGGATGTRQEALKKWYAFLAERRVCPGILPSPKFTRATDGTYAMDTSDFDWAAAWCFDELGMNVAYTPWFFYSFGWARAPRKLFGLEPFTPEHSAAYTACLKLYLDHLREKGWEDRIVLYVSDEPHFRHEHIREQMIKVIAMIKSAWPEARIYSSTWRHCPEWDGHLSVWGVGAYGCFPVETMHERRKAGDRIWFTTDGQMCLDTPYCAIERLMPWYCMKYGVEAYEFWGVNWYTYDPWDAGWHRFISQSSDGENYFFVRYPNGDGYLAYPGKRVGVDGPVSSVRLEQAREGVEDYEYLRLLGQLIARAKKQGVSTLRAERVREQALSLVTIPNAGGRYSTRILPDPDAVPQRRAQVADAIERLERRLR